MITRSPEDEVCLKCAYHSMLSEYVCCDFILCTGKRRGCDPGPKCDKFIPGSNKKRLSLQSTCAYDEIPHEKVCELYGVKPKQNRVYDMPRRRNETLPRQKSVKINPGKLEEVVSSLGGETIKAFQERIGIAHNSIYYARRRGSIGQDSAEKIERATGIKITL